MEGWERRGGGEWGRAWVRGRAGSAARAGWGRRGSVRPAPATTAPARDHGPPTRGRPRGPPPAATAAGRTRRRVPPRPRRPDRSEEHTSELQSQFHLVCRLLLEKKNRSTT